MIQHLWAGLYPFTDFPIQILLTFQHVYRWRLHVTKIVPLTNRAWSSWQIGYSFIACNTWWRSIYLFHSHYDGTYQNVLMFVTIPAFLHKAFTGCLYTRRISSENILIGYMYVMPVNLLKKLKRVLSASITLQSSSITERQILHTI